MLFIVVRAPPATPGRPRCGELRQHMCSGFGWVLAGMSIEDSPVDLGHPASADGAVGVADLQRRGAVGRRAAGGGAGAH